MTHFLFLLLGCRTQHQRGSRRLPPAGRNLPQPRRRQPGFVCCRWIGEALEPGEVKDEEQESGQEAKDTRNRLH